MKRTVRSALYVTAALIVVIGGVIGYESLGEKNAPEVGIETLPQHCGDWVVVTGRVKQVQGNSYVISDASVEDVLPNALLLHILVPQEKVKMGLQPAEVEKVVRVRGKVVCGDAAGISMIESERITRERP